MATEEKESEEKLLGLELEVLKARLAVTKKEIAYVECVIEIEQKKKVEDDAQQNG